ncbi:MAG: undecaprenyldiphospho-muramoylpentapeptide beta-N-acetylglucosaminyltransferase [Janthinobacterium lividum]
MKNIILNAGGTGGHFFSAIAIGEELIKRGINVHLITDLRCKKYIDQDLVSLTAHIVDVRIKNSSVLSKIRFLFELLLATSKALLILYKIRPSLMLSFGGYPTIPGLIAAVILRIPILIHEQNCYMGKINRIFSKVAKAVALSYPGTKIEKKIKNKIIVTGDLIRKNILNLGKKNDFDESIFSIFIFAGSQGAKIFSSLIPLAIAELSKLAPDTNINITQQALYEDQTRISEIYYKIPNISFKLAEFFHDMPSQYSKAQLAVCRAGASTIAELTATGLPAILIPFPYASEDHQYFNAKAIEKLGGGWCFKQSEITPEILGCKIFQLISDRSILQQASSKLQQRKSDGVNILADTVKKIIS